MKPFANFDAIGVGDTQQIVKVITAEDLRKFVEMTGDDNPLHLDPDFAARTSLKEVVVHGMLGASFISTVVGTRLPGPGALWLAQEMEFLLPVRLGDSLTVSCTVAKKHERDRLLELDTRILNQEGLVVLRGTGKVKILSPTAPNSDADRASDRGAAIVTGGSGGIGSAICRRLAADGFRVVVNYLGHEDRARLVVDQINKAGGSAIAVQADVSDPTHARALHAEAVRLFGAVDVLVNNASPRIHPKALGAMEWTDFQRHLDVQVKGAFLLMKACLPSMVSRHTGRIINITSQVIDGTPTVEWTGYAVAKSALAVLSHQIAAEFGPSGITVNCVSPGMTETALIGNIPEKIQLMTARATPLRRLANPEDIAASVAFLASPGGGFVTGQTLRVNGGAEMS